MRRKVCPAIRPERQLIELPEAEYQVCLIVLKGGGGGPPVGVEQGVHLVFQRLRVLFMSVSKAAHSYACGKIQVFFTNLNK